MINYAEVNLYECTLTTYIMPLSAETYKTFGTIKVDQLGLTWSVKYDITQQHVVYNGDENKAALEYKLTILDLQHKALTSCDWYTGLNHVYG